MMPEQSGEPKPPVASLRTSTPNAAGLPRPLPVLLTTVHKKSPMEYETWVSVRSEFAFLFEDVAQGCSVGFPRDFSNIFTRRYHEFLDRDELVNGSLVMILCMALWDIEKHQDAYPLIHDPECHAAIKKFRSQKRAEMRLAETLLIALEIISETDFHSRDTHRKHGQLLSLLPWVREHIILDRFRLLASSSPSTQKSGG